MKIWLFANDKQTKQQKSYAQVHRRYVKHHRRSWPGELLSCPVLYNVLMRGHRELCIFVECSLIIVCLILEEEQKTLKSTLDVDLNLSQHLMSTSQVNISCQHLMSIFQLDFPFLMPSISQYLEFNIYDCYFWVGFPVSAVKYFSKFGILHLRLHFWVGFPISAVKYFSKLKFCIYDWAFGVDFPFPLLSIFQYLDFCIHDCTYILLH